MGYAAPSGGTFAPLLVALGLGKRCYTPEVRVAAAALATRTSYGEVSEALERDRLGEGSTI